MKKKIGIRSLFFIVPIMIILISSFATLSVKADKPNLSSKGNFVFEDGRNAAFYADDIQYLQGELVKLFNEIPNQQGGK